eukprot:gb/GECG01003406.1/.p1 GENE.gb/GECG01003406.1/~~gb/GECG01003406.1/.p1  ORF type:complete len:1786 (+),score=287.15 gb/GECG01003406.1/:1-5358(+)
MDENHHPPHPQQQMNQYPPVGVGEAAGGGMRPPVSGGASAPYRPESGGGMTAPVRNGSAGGEQSLEQLSTTLRPGEFEAVVPRVDGSLCLQVQMLRIVNGIPCNEQNQPLIDLPDALPPNTPVQAISSAPVVVGFTPSHLGNRSPIENALDLHAGDIIVGVNDKDLRRANKSQVQAVLGPRTGEQLAKIRFWRPWPGEWKWQGLGQSSDKLLQHLRSRGVNPDSFPANHLLSIRVRTRNHGSSSPIVYEYGPCVIQGNDVTGSLSHYARIYDLMVVEVWGWADPRIRFSTNFLYANLQLQDELAKVAGRGVPSAIDGMVSVQHHADDPGSTDGSCSAIDSPCCTLVIQPSVTCVNAWKAVQHQQQQQQHQQGTKPESNAPSGGVPNTQQHQQQKTPGVPDVPKPALVGSFQPNQMQQLRSQILAFKYLSNQTVPPKEVYVPATGGSLEEQPRMQQQMAYHHSGMQRNTQLPSRDRAQGIPSRFNSKNRKKRQADDDDDDAEENFRASVPSDLLQQQGQRRTSRRSAGRRNRDDEDVVSDVSSDLYDDDDSEVTYAQRTGNKSQDGTFKIEKVFGVRYGELEEWKWEDQDPQAAAELKRDDLSESEKELLERRRDRAIMQKRLQLHPDENDRRKWDKLEYLVKWKGLSYLHVEWVTVHLLRELGRWAVQKARKFAENEEGRLQLDQEESSILALRDPPSVHISGYFDSSYIEVDRIVAKKHIDVQDLDPKEREELEKIGATSKALYLVKWVSLPYSEATWEIADEIQDDEKISQFERNNKPPTPATLQAHPTILWDERPPPTSWKKYGESQVYKGGRTLREYQVEGLNWLIFNWYNRRSAILADEMGLGKTVQTISFLDHLRSREHVPGPFLLLAPLSTLGHWKSEVESWTNLNAVVYHDQNGGAAGRELIREYEWFYEGEYGQQLAQRGVYKFNLLLTSYQVLLQDWEYLSRISWRTVIVDEAHALKNAFSQLSTSLRGLDIKHLILLTGTPLQNNVTELWTLLNLVSPQKFPSLEDFVAKYGEMRNQDQVKELLEAVRPILLRRIKTDVEKSLPPKEETIINVELTNLQKQYYRAVFDKNRSFLSRGAEKIPMANLSNIEMELRKCCNHPYLIDGVEQREAEELLHQGLSAAELASQRLSRLISSSGKMVLLDKLLPKLQSEGHRSLLFSQFSIMLDLLEEYLRWKSIKYERIDGSVRGNSRQAAIDRFNAPNSDTTVFLLSTKAGGQGINLTSADTVIIFDSDWNPQNDIQAQARCHRIGQTADIVRVYRLVTSRTYESEMFRRASKKLGLHQAVFETGELKSKEAENEETELTSLLKLDKDKVEALLRYGAYAVMDEDSQKTRSDIFNDADIDSILKNSMTVRYGSDGEIQTAEAGGKVVDAAPSEESKKQNEDPNELFHFNKATFASSENNENLDVNDPSFWEKVLGPRPIDKLQRTLEEGKVVGLKATDSQKQAGTNEGGNSSSTEEMSLEQFLSDICALVKEVDADARQGQRHDDAESIESLLVELKVRGSGVAAPAESNFPPPSFLSKSSHGGNMISESERESCDTVDKLASTWLSQLSQGPSKRVRSRKRGPRPTMAADIYGIPTAKPRSGGAKRGRGKTDSDKKKGKKPVESNFAVRLRKLDKIEASTSGDEEGSSNEDTADQETESGTKKDLYRYCRVAIFERASGKEVKRAGTRGSAPTLPKWVLEGRQPQEDEQPYDCDAVAKAASTTTSSEAASSEATPTPVGSEATVGTEVTTAPASSSTAPPQESGTADATSGSMTEVTSPSAPSSMASQ